MSYEGREQHICENGHRYDAPCNYGESDLCHCGAKSAWCNRVDDTNGDEYGFIVSEEFKKLLITAEVVETCNLGHAHVTKEATYRLPNFRELTRTYLDWENDNKRTNLVHQHLI